MPPRRRFSQAAAPFIASCRLGIHRMRLFTWPYNPNRPGRGARASSTSLRLFSLSAFSAHAAPPPPAKTGRQAAAHARTSRTVKEKNRPQGRPSPPPGDPQAHPKRACGSPQSKPPNTPPADTRRRRAAPGGGAREDRTPDLLRARQALSRLSYGPVGVVVGLGGIEPPTSPLSGVRSNQLSYRPGLPVRSGNLRRAPAPGALRPRPA